MEAGALATLSEHVLESADFPYIVVESSLQAVKDIAEFYLKQLQIPVVGITGSVGKDQHQGSDRFCTQPEIPHFENTGKL